MKIKLIRKQKYIIETEQEVEVDINDIDENDLDELFYDSPEFIKSGDEMILFNHPDDFDYEGYDVMIDDKELIRIDSYRNTSKDDLPDWSQLPKSSLKEYLRNKKIDKLLKQK